MIFFFFIKGGFLEKSLTYFVLGKCRLSLYTACALKCILLRYSASPGSKFLGIDLCCSSFDYCSNLTANLLA